MVLLENLKSHYREQFSDRRFLRSLAAGFGLLFLSLVANYFGALYAFKRASNHVEDIILSNIPTFDVDAIFMWGPLVFWIILSAFLLYDPKKIPFTLKSVALFVLIRSFFISLTHIGPFPDHISLDAYNPTWLATYLETNPAFTFIFTSGADLFFSGHTGIPFLMGLTFWKNRLIRIFCILASIFFGIIVLLGHLHYSIDVAAAFFITYTISRIAAYIWRADRERFADSYAQSARKETTPAVL